MYKIKFLAFMAVTAVFFACGSQDGSPPKLKNGVNPGNPVFISPFDPLVAEFDSRIVNIDSIIYFQPIARDLEQTSGNKLYFVGKYGTAEGGFEHFKPNEKDSIIFVNAENDDGYKQRRAVFYYSTYPILDGPNNNIESPDDIVENFGRTNLTQGGVTFAGVIGINTKTEWADFNDYFKLSLKAYDSLYIKLSNTKNVKLELIAPFKTKDTTIAAISNSIVYEMDPRNFDVLNWETPVQFKIRVFPDSTISTPYLLTVKVTEYNN